jgi:Tol biopolymer transport system component
MSLKRQLVIAFIILFFISGCAPTPPPTVASPTQTITQLSATETPLPPTATPATPTATLPPTETATASPTATDTAQPITTSIPQFSSDGQIVFVSTRSGNADLYTLNLANGELEQLTTSQGDTANYWPAWSPNGDQIAFESPRDGNFELYSLSTDSEDLQRLTNNNTDDMYLTWSPDGTRIAFMGMQDDNIDIYMINANGSNLQRLTDDPAIDYTPAWSPDGTRIAFSSHRDGNGEIYLVNPDDHDPVRLTDSPREDYAPAWSPDGSQIVFASERDGNWEIYIMDSDGNNPRRLTDHPRLDSFPAWSPDGKWIAFSSERDGDMDIYAISVDGSELYRITNSDADDWGVDWNPTIMNLSPVDQPAISVPQGTSVAIDGNISPEEWAGAAVETFADGSELLLLQNEGHLYLGIRGNTTEMIVGNIFINRNDEISILHASAALGTAIYQQEEDSWQQTQTFEWCCRGTSNSASDQAERDDFFQHEGWISVNARMGTPNELEYQIIIGDAPLRLAVNYLKVSSDPNDEKIAWPSNLTDDCSKPTPGGLPTQFNFTPDIWVSLDF